VERLGGAVKLDRSYFGSNIETDKRDMDEEECIGPIDKYEECIGPRDKYEECIGPRDKDEECIGPTVSNDLMCSTVWNNHECSTAVWNSHCLSTKSTKCFIANNSLNDEDGQTDESPPPRINCDSQTPPPHNCIQYNSEVKLHEACGALLHERRGLTPTGPTGSRQCSSSLFVRRLDSGPPWTEHEPSSGNVHVETLASIHSSAGVQFGPTTTCSYPELIRNTKNCCNRMCSSHFWLSIIVGLLLLGLLLVYCSL